MGIYVILFAGFVIGFLIGGEFTKKWMLGKSKLMKNHPHPDAADIALAEAQEEEKADEAEEDEVETGKIEHKYEEDDET